MRRTSMPAAAPPPSPARPFHHHYAATATASKSSSSAAPNARGGAAIRGRIRRFHSALDATPIPLVPVARATPHRASTSGLPPAVPASTPAALAVHLIPLRRSPSPASSSRGGRAGSTNTATTTDGTGHALVHHHPHPSHHVDDVQLQDIGTSSGPPLLPSTMARPLPGAPGSQLPLVPAIKSFLWSLFQMVVWFGTAICLILTGVDLFVQALDKPPPTAMYLQLIIVGSYALLVTAALLFAFSRFMTVRTALALLPKLYVPTSAMDLPHHVHAHIATALDRALTIARACGPAPGTPSAAVEWGDPDSPLADTQFRDAAVASLDLLADRLAPFRHVARIQPVAARPLPPPRGPGRPVSAAPTATSLSGVTSTSAGTAPWIPRSRAARPVGLQPMASATPAPRLRALPVRPWFRRLVAARLVDKRLAKRYLDTYDRARWGRAPITVDEYLAFMKVLAMILQGLPPPPPLAAGGMAAPLIEVEPGVL
ncbi:hypothetical protein AMAG_01926 [Allomyces macrogynus ATCC 38327]|uniref:Defect at low temperature protein 1 n=1 Tax=Allomyces macrogynus (strain ATCC 38327) TaxID=578462 RepID=A0A0L0S0L1_ALLM3|nr:hypothetical protein AMAG_01926 [Allomyces macrogynus ATCC 38327]|eukprot:KNE56083.1 hypothetical protein AMAG_01926 [Allomyces macrogynus ATCC 38327]